MDNIEKVQTKEKKPWHRQENESTKAFHAFMLYRDMLPKGRSIQKVLETTDKKPSYYRHLARWSSRYEWVKRATFHDDHMAEVKREANQKAIEEMAERQAKEGMALQQKGIERLADMAGREMRMRDAIRAIEVGAKLERTARGEPSEITKHQIVPGTEKRLEDMTDAELDEIIERRGVLPEGKEEKKDGNY